MPDRIPLDFQFPLGGLNKHWAYRKQPPYTSPDCLNVRGYETVERRARGGQRPGLGKAFAEELGGGEPTHMLAQVTAVGADVVNEFLFVDDFARDGSDLGGSWVTASWKTAQPATKTAMGGAYEDVEEGDAVCKALSFSTSSAYQVELRILPYMGEHWGWYRIYARMDNASPDVTDEGIEVALHLTGANGAYSGRLTSYSSGSGTDYAFSTGNTTVAGAGWFKVLVSANNIKVYWAGNLLLDQNVSAHSGRRLGFGLHVETTYPPAICIGDIFRVRGTPVTATVGLTRRTYLVGSAGGDVYCEKEVGTLTRVTGVVANLAHTHLVQATEWGQKLYIADYDIARVTGSDGTVAANGTDLTAVSVSSWTAHGINKHTDVVVVTNGTGNVTDGTYEIDSILAAKLVLGSSVGGNGTCTFRVHRGPKIYDPSTDAVTLWLADSGKGQVASGCQCVCTYRDCLMLAGPEAAPHMWYLLRQGDPLDGDTSAEDDQRAIDGQSADAGRIGDVIRALIPFADDYVIFGCMGSIWFCRGHPAVGGTIDSVSHEAGILDKGAWCWGVRGEVYFLAKDGLYRMMIGAGGLAPPKNISQNSLPLDLYNLDPLWNEILLLWDEAAHGVHIYVTPKTAITGYHYFYNVRLKAFWRDKNYSEHGPTAGLNYKTEVTGSRGLLLGGRDGYVRCYEPANASDDGEALDSYVVYQPLRLANADSHEGKLIQLDASLGASSGKVDYEVKVGATHEAAVDADAFLTGEWSGDGLQHTVRPRARGGSVTLKLSNAEAKAWLVEKIHGLATVAGRHRLG